MECGTRGGDCQGVGKCIFGVSLPSVNACEIYTKLMTLSRIQGPLLTFSYL